MLNVPRRELPFQVGRINFAPFAPLAPFQIPQSRIEDGSGSIAGR
jgi:hypothetical protein